MEKTNFYALVCLAAALCLFSLSLGYLVQKNGSKLTLPMHATVSSGVIGFNVTEALEFGSIPNDGGGRKTIFVQNNFAEERTVLIRTYGDMASWTAVSKNDFPIKPGELLNLTVTIVVPKNTMPGDYYGSLEITLK